ncbi:MAG: response regulator transcription factor [Candidatus Acidiferrum sp.]
MITEHMFQNRNQFGAQQVAKAKIFLVDDHPIVRQGLGLLINREADLVVCGEADGAPGALQGIASLQPDLMVIDISLDGPDGIELLKTIRVKEPILPVLILSMHEESTYAERSLRAGANGYIMKQEATERVLVAIRRILDGKVYLSERLTNRMLEQFVHGAGSSKSDPLGTLSDRELEVYRLIGAGHGTRKIAEELHVSVKTVESYQAHIKEKLSLRNARELVQHAIESTLTDKSASALPD